MTNYSMVNRTYRYMTATPLYKFGYGLSYSKFNYSKFEVSSKNVQRIMFIAKLVIEKLSPQGGIKPCDPLEMKVTVTNIGSVVGSEVVQFYATFTVGVTGSQPVQSLESTLSSHRIHLSLHLGWF